MCVVKRDRLCGHESKKSYRIWITPKALPDRHGEDVHPSRVAYRSSCPRSIPSCTRGRSWLQRQAGEQIRSCLYAKSDRDRDRAQSVKRADHDRCGQRGTILRASPLFELKPPIALIVKRGPRNVMAPCDPRQCHAITRAFLNDADFLANRPKKTVGIRGRQNLNVAEIYAPSA